MPDQPARWVRIDLAVTTLPGVTIERLGWITRLRALAYEAWPVAVPLPRGLSDDDLSWLVDHHQMTVIEGDRYRIDDIDEDRSARVAKAQKMAGSRWSGRASSSAGSSAPSNASSSASSNAASIPESNAASDAASDARGREDERYLSPVAGAREGEDPTMPRSEDDDGAVFAWLARNVGYVPEHGRLGQMVVRLVADLGAAEVRARLIALRDAGRLDPGDAGGYVFAVRDAFRRPARDLLPDGATSSETPAQRRKRLVTHLMATMTDDQTAAVAARGGLRRLSIEELERMEDALDAVVG